MLLETLSFSFIFSKIVIVKGVAQGICSEILGIFGQLVLLFLETLTDVLFQPRCMLLGIDALVAR